MWRTARHEFAQWQRSWAGAAAEFTGTEHPIAVVTAGKIAGDDPAHGEMQAELAALSSRSRHDVVAGAGHEELVITPEYAARVAQSIEWVRAEAVALADTDG
ncbi:hypothetical protein CFN78_12770 [Amycolatopsis antarctica]|uniref:Alpha/beta hydrolase n=1 Tax=Amycolatopsis antarctica TaxID=1854586 RepID=A0A263D3P2_9PSEU|nr:hypothetical protein [Amycolatopsis antarctica]OZM73083.1 hypothetical protein CFN78_12770 [Amycolatopsis antarctica]